MYLCLRWHEVKVRYQAFLLTIHWIESQVSESCSFKIQVISLKLRMPEPYIEPITDRQTCFKCNKTADGKKKLSKCNGCHAITYCCKECQKEDWPRHAWNCVPVMVTEVPGKGQGLVAARDIKMGELIFTDKPSNCPLEEVFRQTQISCNFSSLR